MNSCCYVLVKYIQLENTKLPAQVKPLTTLEYLLFFRQDISSSQGH